MGPRAGSEAGVFGEKEKFDPGLGGQEKGTASKGPGEGKCGERPQGSEGVVSEGDGAWRGDGGADVPSLVDNWGSTDSAPRARGALRAFKLTDRA